MNESRQVEVLGSDEAGKDRVTTAPGPFASFVRFVVCGGGMGLLASAVVPSVAGVMPWAVANALVTVVSTLLCTELHSFITFRTGRWAGRRRHLQSAGSATAAYAVTTAAVLVLHAVQPTAGRLLEQAVYLAAAGLAGIARFLVLRLFVFTDGRDRNESESNSPIPQESRDQQTVAGRPVTLIPQAAMGPQAVAGRPALIGSPAVTGGRTRSRPALVRGRNAATDSVRSRPVRRRPAAPEFRRPQSAPVRGKARRPVPAPVRHHAPEHRPGGLSGIAASRGA